MAEGQGDNQVSMATGPHYRAGFNCIIPRWEPQPIVCLESEGRSKKADYITELQRLLTSHCSGSVRLVDTHDQLAD